MSSTALKNFTAFGFGLPNGRTYTPPTRLLKKSLKVSLKVLAASLVKSRTAS